ncbi:cytochrome c biogenesis protein ResB [Nakamurella sp. YIM 132084]|uniref:Cytochrome c biogenesis protein ResB n=2 Tax=Nakamurella leprariae TaxID=2803911 RepID=A0A938Y970_9ACTN|nr:cytochrome c biogenesis protein ResB [Nakamurella leprariae]
MRVALVLLFLLALASLPGALLPQWSLNQSKTAQYLLDHPTLGPWLDRLGFFDVFASPWYSAIYLLLFTSLVGCLLPRCWEFAQQLRTPPVAAPRNLARLPHHARVEVTGTPDEVAARIDAGLRGWRRTVRAGGATGAGAASDGRSPGSLVPRSPDSSVTVSAEKGYLREVGNLVFHLSLLGLLLAIAAGRLFGYEGSVILNAGQDLDGNPSVFCSSSPANYDNFRPGLTIDGTDLSPFCVQVDSFHAGYTDLGQAVEFDARVQYQAGDEVFSDVWHPANLQVNDPLRMGGERLYLLGHGFTPQFQVTWPDGTQREYEQTFQPENGDPNFLSSGAVKISDPPGYVGDEVREHQLALVGLFAPTAWLQDGNFLVSVFPEPTDPAVAIQAYRGDLGTEDGTAQSVFTIDTDQVDNGELVELDRANLAIGESMTLDDGTVITFTGFREWVSLQTSYDPAQTWALVFAVLLLIGLMISLVIKRRRVWYRIAVLDDAGSESARPRCVVHVGGLARTDQAGYGEEFDRLAALPDRPVEPGARSGR